MAGFGAGANTGGDLFGNRGQNNANSSSQPLSLFGSTATSSAPSTSSHSVFGSTSGTSSSNNGLFSNAKSGSNALEPFSNTGQSSLGNQSGSSLGSPSTMFNPGGNRNDDNANNFPSLSTPNKSSDIPGQSQSGGLLGQTTTSTPANKLFGTNNNSTTPAGPPPANTSATLFGASNTAANASQSGGFFGAASRPPEPSATNQTSMNSNIFGSGNQGGSNSMFKTPTSQSSPGVLFQNNNASTGEQLQATTTSTDASNQGQSSISNSDSITTKPGFSFPSLASTSTGAQPGFSSSNISSAPASAGNPFANSGATKDNPAAAPHSNLFAGIGQRSDAATTQASAPTLFSSTGVASNNAPTPAISSSIDLSKQNTTAATATGATSAPSLFGAASSTATTMPPHSSAAAQGTTGGSQTTTSAPTGSGAGTLGTGPSLSASTTGPAPNAESRLKNKSMDDIITRWASDLTKYQNEFQSQADKIAGWDRQLVENSNAITKLYSKTYQAERDTAEIQRQLTAVESNQDELAQWLDRYEQDIDDLVSRQMSHQDGLQGPDQERERTYKIADGVSERLGEMGQDLTSMIEEINTVSTALSKTNKTDDPVCVIILLQSTLTDVYEAFTNCKGAQRAPFTTTGHRSGHGGYSSKSCSCSAGDSENRCQRPNWDSV